MTQHPVPAFQPALYLHIPFCAARCAYCDFNTYAGLEALFEPYASALAWEIRRAGEAGGRPPARTLFIGGGTPTVLPAPLLAQTLDACFDAFDLDPAAEITCEANPGTTDQASFSALRALGVNRLSLGVQSFDDEELRWLGRIHTALEAERAFSEARTAGFEEINLDLIFGLPGQDPATWQRTLAHALALNPEHLSLYSLTVEHGTPLGRQVRRGLVPEPDDDLAADLYQAACDTLAAHGYLHYEISNWARSAGQRSGVSRQPSAISHMPYATRHTPHAIGHECQHNLVYWRREPYLGLGAGAHSFDGARRWWNVRQAPRYIAHVGAGRSPRAGGERILRRLAMGETMMLGLRLLQEGVPFERFGAQFGIELEEAFGAEIDRLVSRGLLERLPDRVRLTPAAWLLGNRVFAEFMPP
jgi:oxygen-independent coproporphyrinogen III oxidase